MASSTAASLLVAQPYDITSIPMARVHAHLSDGTYIFWLRAFTLRDVNFRRLENVVVCTVKMRSVHLATIAMLYDAVAPITTLQNRDHGETSVGTCPNFVKRGGQGDAARAPNC